jgi:hypothetical protein
MCSAPQLRRPIGHRTGKAARASDSESHFPLTHKSGNIEMLPFIILVLLVILTKSPVAIAGLLSYSGLFGYIFCLQRTSGTSLDRSRRDASVTEGHFETTDHLQQDIAVRPAGHATAGSGLVRRLVRATSAFGSEPDTAQVATTSGPDPTQAELKSRGE